ncbi:MAG: DUF2252 family protein [Anaerolineales bacterium]|nr:DUF2252 family protein [Anaerolineales bacterium]
MDIKKATEKYEKWVNHQIPINQADLQTKHERMANSPFEFLRATFYRWTQVWPETCEKEKIAPQVLVVGDLHVENFGTWRDDESRLVWGVNDFDEACYMPYTSDLIRLAASAELSSGISLDLEQMCQEILNGYSETLQSGRKSSKPIILAEKNDWLREIALGKLRYSNNSDRRDKFEEFWEKLLGLKPLKEPLEDKRLQQAMDQARLILERILPQPLPDYELVWREAGLGSLGRPRFVARVKNWQGGLIAREAKALTLSAWLWAQDDDQKQKIRYQEILDTAVRSSDPKMKVIGAKDDIRWIVRRLAPDADKIKLTSPPKKHQDNLLRLMGRETANIHLGSKGQIAEIREDLKKRCEGDIGWLLKATEKMVDAIKADYKDWKDR